MSDEEMNSIWTPFVIYNRTDNNEATKVDHKFKDLKTTMAVTREGSFIRSTMESVDEIELYKAAFNIFFVQKQRGSRFLVQNVEDYVLG